MPDAEPVTTEPVTTEPVPTEPVPPGLHWAHPRFLTCIIAGGLLGTLGRYELELAWPTPAGHFPLVTFTINTSGAFLLGFLLALLGGSRRPSPYARPFIGTGILGGWTTYSTLVVEATTLGKGGQLGLAAAYLAATLAAGIAAVALGISLGPFGLRRTAAALTSDPLE